MNKLTGMSFTQVISPKQQGTQEKKECKQEDCCCFQGKPQLKGQPSQDQISFSGPLTGSR